LAAHSPSADEAPRPTAETATDEDVARLEAKKRAEWRQNVRSWWSAETAEPPPNLVGVALSGGGIRSATFSLGVVQALAKTGALARIGILSTVSGGSYIGCFVRSLFVPPDLRGVAPGKPEPEPGDIEDQAEFARRALISRADEREIDGPSSWRKVRNPIWWLREHSRYLAPNGPIDYGYALALIARNWVAMLYIFFLALAAIMTLVIGIEAVAAALWPPVFDWTWQSLPVGDLAPSGDSAIRVQRDAIAWQWSLDVPRRGAQLPISPIIALAALPGVLSALAAVAFWMTQAMSPNEPDLRRQWRNLIKPVSGVLASAAAIGAVFVLLPRLLDRDIFPPIAKWMVAGLVLICIGAVTVALVTALYTALVNRRRGRMLNPAMKPGRRQLFTAELRRRLTRLLAFSNWIALVLMTLGLIDSAGAWLRRWYWDQTDVGVELATTVILPLFAFLIRKLSDWFKDGKSRVAALLRRFMSPIALVAGLVLYGSLAVIAAAVVHAAIWKGDSWASAPDGWTALFFAVAVFILAVLGGSATGFINLSSLHGYYASRLTRAYLGASNVARLSDAANDGGRIFDNHEDDFIRPSVYGGVDIDAPLHIINATLNETVDLESQVVARDRKGDLFSVEPGGVRAGTGGRLVPWERLDDPTCAEQLSLGQWCAISGASASPGMGRLTDLGLALALTFANFRLGYWWWSPDVSSTRARLAFAIRRVDGFFGTFIYLWNEMTARYSRGWARKYLSDGGHYENSGAYALIRRDVPLILVADAGADPDYDFDDLENLVRKARLDLGAEISLLSGRELERYLESVGCTDRTLFVDPAEQPDWRAAFVDPNSPVAAIALRVRVAASRRQRGGRELRMVWIKPRRFADMPHDIAGYAAAHPDFPQQPTRDQFFDESQWESYRKLGEIAVERLLGACPGLLK
jgi:hypothetical protein